MHGLKALFLILPLLATASASANSSMIEVSANGVAKAPYYDQQGKQLDAIPVMIRKTGDGKAEIVAFRVPSDDIADEEYDGILGTWSIDLSVAEDFGFTFGVIIGRVGCGEEFFKGLCGGDGVLIQAGVSADAARASIGYAIALGVGSGTHSYGMLGLPLFGIAGKATVLKTFENVEGWGSLLTPSPDALYVGGEVEISAFLKFSIALFRRVSTNEKLIQLGGSDNEWLLNLGTGIGF